MGEELTVAGINVATHKMQEKANTASLMRTAERESEKRGRTTLARGERKDGLLGNRARTRQSLLFVRVKVAENVHGEAEKGSDTL